MASGAGPWIPSVPGPMGSSRPQGSPTCAAGHGQVMEKIGKTNEACSWPFLLIFMEDMFK